MLLSSDEVRGEQIHLENFMLMNVFAVIPRTGVGF